ncbi:MAG: DDE-type integrase/transposase/recombinase [bacterium]
MEKRKQNWIVRRYLAGMPAKKIATHLQISVRTVYYVLQHYKNFGSIIEPKSVGRPKRPLNKNCKVIIKNHWQKYQCGSVKLHNILSSRGFGVSQRKIQQVLDEYNLTSPCPKRRGQRKYCSYRWPSCLMVLHTDWTTCPITGKQLIAFIDDHSRFVAGYGLYDDQTTKSTLDCLFKTIFQFGVPYAIITDRGAQFYANKIGKKKKGKCQFQLVLEEMGIRHIVARAHHPQTNGKIERWFGTYKREFNERFSSVDEYVCFYNYERPHQRLRYKTPAEAFENVHNFEIARFSDDKKCS